MNDVVSGSGTEEDPWVLKTPPLTSEFQVWKDAGADPPAVVVQVGKTRLSYRLRALEDAHAMLRAHGDWMPLGNADEGKPAAPDTLDGWARSQSNPVGGYCGLSKGYRGRFTNYVGATLEVLGRAELEHNARNNGIRAV
ncbi:MAG: DUF6855 family protein [Pseudomonadota bacterium]